MKTMKETAAQKVPIVCIDPKLAELDKVILFPGKVEKARATIAKIGLPKRVKRA